MSDPAAFDQDRVRIDSECLNLRDAGYIRAGALDPRVTAVDALKGSIYMSSSVPALFVKNDNGSTTNWRMVSDFNTASITEVTSTSAPLTTSVLTRYVRATVEIGSPFTITLHSAAALPGQEVVIDRTDTDLYTAVSVTDGTTTWKMYGDEKLRFISTGTDWRLISRVIPENDIDFSFLANWDKYGGTSPVINDGTITAVIRRQGKWAHIRYKIQMGGATTYGDANGHYTLSTPKVPGGSPYLRIDTSKIFVPGIFPLDNGGTLGTCSFLDDSTSTKYVGRVIALDSISTVRLISERVNAPSASATEPVKGGVTNSTGPFAWASGDWLEAEFRVPILEWEG